MRQYTQTILESIHSDENFLVACLDVQASVYVLHLGYEAPDDDPFYELDSFIVKLLQYEPKLDLAYTANIVGLEPSFIRYRFQKLKAGGFLQENGNGCSLTSAANEYYLSGKRPLKHYDKDVYINSKTFDFLPVEIYQMGVDVTTKINTNLSYEPLTDNYVAKLEKNINKASAKMKSSLMIHADAEQVKIEGFTKCALANFQSAYFLDMSATNVDECIKQQIYYKGVQINECWCDFPSISMLSLSSNGIILNKRENDGWKHEEIINAISSVLLKEQKFTKNSVRFFDRAIILEICRNDLNYVVRKNAFMNALNAGYYVLPINDPVSEMSVGDFLLHLKVEDPYVQWLIKINAIADSLSYRDIIDSNEIFPSYAGSKTEWRKALILLEKYDVLEKIDVSLFINATL